MRAKVLDLIAPVLLARDPITLTVGKYGTPVFTERCPRPLPPPDLMNPFGGAILPPASFSRH